MPDATDRSATADPLMLPPYRVHGFASGTPPGECRLDSTTDAYAADQWRWNAAKARAFLIPLLEGCGARSVLEVGCGVGAMVEVAHDAGYRAYGVDVPSLAPRWADTRLDRARYFAVDPREFVLPFKDASLDFVFTLGVIEHVGTVDGHATRRPDYHAVRRAWIREVYRVVRPGGHLLVGGPNRGFPVDAAHGPDGAAGPVARALFNALAVSVHPPWGAHFLWSYGDLARYLVGLPHRMTPMRVGGLLNCSRVPGPLRPAARLYLEALPAALLGTGFNPWTLALIHRTE